jgi:hypothetical protein
MELEMIPDELLELSARVDGAECIEAKVLARLRQQRAKDRQVYAFRIGGYWMTGAMPDAKTEMILIECVEELEGEDE